MNDQPKDFKPYAVLSIFLMLVLVVGFIAKGLILGEKVVNLGPAEPLYGQISQLSLNGSGGNKILSADDYTLSNQQYLDNNAWVVTKFTPPNNQGDAGYVLMNKIGPFYEVVLGPGTVFPSNLSGIPTSVQAYLSSQGLFEQGSGN